MIRLLLLLLLGTVYAQEPEYFENDINKLVDPSSQESDDDMLKDLEETDDMTGDLEETDLKDLKSQTSHDTTLKCDSEATCHYKLFTWGQNFRNAQRVCRRHRGNLCSIRNSWVNNRLRAFARCYNQRLVWIGVRKPLCRRQYYNVDGRRLTYTNFGWRQRKCRGRWCVALNTSTGKWVSVRCWRRLPYICRI